MNKKIIYSLVLTSIFIISMVSVCIQPAAGANWKFGVPKEAKGLKLQSEVKVYDKDQWGYSLGYCADETVNWKYGGDGTSANNVGARSQSEISDWETDDIWLFGDYLMESDVSPNCDGSKVILSGVTLTDYWSAAVLVDDVTSALGLLNASRALTNIGIGYIPTDPHYYDPGWGHGKVAMLESAVATALSQGYLVPFYGAGAQRFDWLLADSSLGSNYSIWQSLWTASQLFEAGTGSRAELSALYHKTYKGTVITRDSWDFSLDLDSDPDEEDAEAPFLEDPHSYYDSYKYFSTFLYDRFDLIDNMIDSILYFNTTFHASTNPYAKGQIKYIFNLLINASLEAAYGSITYPTVGWQAWAGLNAIGIVADPVDAFVEALLAPEGNHPLQGGEKGLLLIKPFFQDAAPLQKKAYLAMVIDSGLPCYQPVDKYLEKVIDDFDIDEDVFWGDNSMAYTDIRLQWVYYPVGPLVYTYTGTPITDDLHQGGITVDGLVVTVEYDWPDGLLNNPIDPDSEREDYEIVYTYGDTGGQSKTQYFAGDEVFYEIQSIAPTIPGYEVSILLGAAAIAILGLIFVVIKKRRM